MNISRLDFTIWLQENQQKLYWILSIAFIPLSLFFYFVSKKSHSKWEDYLQAHFTYQKWIKNPSVEAESFQKLLTLAHHHRGLQEKYGSLIAEKCIALNQTNLAASFVESSLKQIKDQIPYHHLFSKTSVLIADGKYDLALEEAIALKEKIEKEDQTRQFSVLFLFNWIRIASLERTLNQSQKEFASLIAIKRWLESDACTKEASGALSTAFTTGSLSFLDYINHRLSNI